ncbi:MAG: hypothetical protein J07HX64_02719 [halophilic archaeon J07HX64]|jgi:hypothetical protein|nr:MAG: hypothetical protein J07HX64_02719 [halophilic archaeon J07HX64]
MFQDVGKFQVFLGFLGAIGVIAVAVSFGAVFVVLTGGTDGGGEAASFPEGFGCDQFNGDPNIGHEANYGITQNVTRRVLDSVQGGLSGGGFELSFNMSDPTVLNASARHPDGTPLSLETRNATVTVSDNSTDSFRLWIDSADRGVITRTELDICPP